MLAISAKAFKATAIDSASSFIILYIKIYFDWITRFYVCAKPEKTAKCSARQARGYPADMVDAPSGALSA
jgi:hypothetical protein